MKKTTRSLFESRQAWDSDPENAFFWFVVDPKFLEMGRRVSRLDAKNPHEPPIRASSVKIYQQMFRRFLRFSKDNGKTVFTVSHTDIMAFLNAGHGQEVRPEEKNAYKPLTSTIRVRYLRLLERAFQYLERCMAARDRTMLSMLLGTGLTVSEVLGVEVEAIGKHDANGSMSVTILPEYTDGTSRKHTALLQPFACPEVLAWLKHWSSMVMRLRWNDFIGCFFTDMGEYALNN